MDSPRPDFFSQLDRVLAPLTWIAAAFTVFVLVVGPEVIGADVPVAAAPSATPAATATEAPAETPAETPADGAEELPTATAEPTEEAPDTAAGEAVFASAGCGGCHTLAAANASGAIGPNLDDLQPSEDAVKTVVTDGRGGMPAFGGDLSPEEIDAVAAYVAASAGG